MWWEPTSLDVACSSSRHRKLWGVCGQVSTRGANNKMQVSSSCSSAARGNDAALEESMCSCCLRAEPVVACQWCGLWNVQCFGPYFLHQLKTE